MNGNDLHPSYSWEYEGTAEVKAGPELGEVIDVSGMHTTPRLRNQCTFIRSHTLALGDTEWQRVQSVLASTVKTQTSTPSTAKSLFGSLLSVLPLGKS